jgi:hypothetical protein
MSVGVSIAIAIILFSVVFLSMFNVLMLSYIAVHERTFKSATRVVYPLAIVAVCGLELDRIQYTLTGVNGLDDSLLFAVVVLVLAAAVIRTVSLLDARDN